MSPTARRTGHSAMRHLPTLEEVQQELTHDRAKRAITVASALAATEAVPLPPLDGFPEQVEWAREIRACVWIDLNRLLADERAESGEASDDVKELTRAAESLFRQTSARWWVDRRNRGVRSLLGEIICCESNPFRFTSESVR